MIKIPYTQCQSCDEPMAISLEDFLYLQRRLPITEPSLLLDLLAANRFIVLYPGVPSKVGAWKIYYRNNQPFVEQNESDAAPLFMMIIDG